MLLIRLISLLLKIKSKKEKEKFLMFWLISSRHLFIISQKKCLRFMSWLEKKLKMEMKNKSLCFLPLFMKLFILRKSRVILLLNLKKQVIRQILIQMTQIFTRARRTSFILSLKSIISDLTVKEVLFLLLIQLRWIQQS